LKGTREQRQGIVDSFGASPNDTPLSVSLRPPFAAAVAGQRYNATEKSKETQMAQKVIDIVGTSKESFAKAAENAVAEAAKTVRGMKWARVAELEMELDGKKIVKYRTTTKIYFDIEK
jgi:flavin-binding protein dodecin